MDANANFKQVKTGRSKTFFQTMALFLKKSGDMDLNVKAENANAFIIFMRTIVPEDFALYLFRFLTEHYGEGAQEDGEASEGEVETADVKDEGGKDDEDMGGEDEGGEVSEDGDEGEEDEDMGGEDEEGEENEGDTDGED